MKRPHSFWSTLSIALGLLSPLKPRGQRRRERQPRSLRRFRNTPLCVERLEDRHMLSTVSVMTASGSESSSSIPVYIMVSPTDYQNNISVDWATASNTATSGSDFTAANGTATITAGNSYTIIYVSPINDTLDEADYETLYVNLSNPVNATIGTGQAMIGIGDNDSPPTVSVADVSAAEGSSLTFELTLSAASGRTITVGYYTYDGSASSSSDYTATGYGNSVQFNPGETSKTVNVATTNDSNKESDETVNFYLSSLTNVTAGDTTAVGTIIDNDRTNRTNADGDLSGENYAEHAGGVKEAFSILSDGGCVLVYDSLTAGKQLVAIETVQPNDGSTPNKIKAELTFGGVAGDTKWFNGSNLAPGSTQRFTLSADCSGLSTGRYQYTVKLTEYYTSGSPTTRTFTGYQTVINRNSSEFGKNWWLAGLDRLHVQGDGVLWVQGDNIAAWYAQSGGSYTRPAGYFEDLAYDSGIYTLTRHDGGKLLFDSSGYLTQRQDTNGNSWEYTYSSGKLATITDPTGRETDFTYTSGKLSSVTDPYARTAYVNYTSGKLTNIELFDPDGAGSLAAPEWDFTYASGSGLIETISDPRDKATTFSYDSLWRVSEVEDPLDETVDYFPAVTCGYPTSGGTEFSPATLPDNDDDRGHVVDALGNDIYINVNDRGQTTQLTNQLGHVWTYVRNSDGQVTSLTGPDPDGGGPRSAPVWEYTYTDGDLTGATLPDDEEQSWDYHEDYHVVTRSDDELGRITLYEIDDENGNVLSVTRVVGEIDDEINEETDDVTVAAYTYTPAPESAGDLPGGLLLTIEDALGRVTEYDYQDNFQSLDFGRLISVTFAADTADEAVWTYGYDAYGNVDTVVDPISRTTIYEYDKLNRLIELTQPDPDGGGSQTSPVWTWEYDASGNVLVETDALGNETAYEYDDRGLLVEITYADPDGGGSQASPVVEFEYNAAGWLTSETDPLGNVTAYEYNDLGWLTEVTLPDPDGAGSQTSPVYSTTYDALGLVLTETDPLSGVTSYEYSIRGFLTKITQPDPDGAGSQTSPVYEFAYDVAGQLTTETDALDRETEYEYDVFGRVIEVTLPDPDGAGSLTSPVWSWEYDAVGNVVAETNPLDETVDFTYDNLDRLTKREKTYVDGPYGPYDEQTEIWEYNDASEVVEYSFQGKVTAFEHDGLGRLVEVTLPDPDGAGSQAAPVYGYEYDAVGNVLVEVDALGNETVNDYDNLYRLVSTTLPDPDGAGGQSSPVWQFNYNAAGWLTKTTDALGRETTYTLDNLGRQTKTTLPDPDGAGGQAAAEYTTVFDAAGNVLSETNALGKTTNHDYDALHRLIETQLPDPDGAGSLGRPTTTFTYDAVGNMLSLTDPVGNTTEWAYDGLDRIIEETNELAASRTYEYDALNRLVEYTDRNGLVTQFDFDFFGRMVEETWLDGQTTVNTLTFDYDLSNQLLGAADDFSDYTYTYDNLSRLTSTVIDNGGPTVRLSHTWDGNSNRTSLEAEIDSGGGYAPDFVNEFTFDNLSRITRVEQTDGGSGGVDVSAKRVDFAYNANNQFTTVTRYEDLAATDLVATSTYGYDQANRLNSLAHAKGATTLADYDWTYDVGSRVTSFTNNLYSSETASYGYDHTDQLTSADRSGSGNDEGYSFDVNGNPTDSGWTVDDDNLLTSDGVYNYQHDDEGNTVKKTNISTGAYVDYFYDHRNRLVKAEFRTSGHTLTKRVELEYDVWDRLIFKAVDTNGNGTYDRYERFVYDGDNLAMAFADLDGQGAGDFTLSNRYLYGPAVDQVLADEQFDASEDLIDTYWTLGDNLGTVRDIANYTAGTDTTAVVNHRAFDSFGELLSETSSAPTTRFYFTGRYFDDDLQLQYNHHRWYDPQQRRWLTKDPIGFAAGDTNTSRYVGNDSTNNTDPSGLQPPPEPLPTPAAQVVAISPGWDYSKPYPVIPLTEAELAFATVNPEAYNAFLELYGEVGREYLIAAGEWGYTFWVSHLTGFTCWEVNAEDREVLLDWYDDWFSTKYHSPEEHAKWLWEALTSGEITKPDSYDGKILQPGDVPTVYTGDPQNINFAKATETASGLGYETAQNGVVEVLTAGAGLPFIFLRHGDDVVRFGKLRSIGDKAWESSCGLRYVGLDPDGLNRVQHVLRHGIDDLSRGLHGVFDGGKYGALGVVDEAWDIVQKGGVPFVQQGARRVYTVPMGKRIGYVGGHAGAAAGNPAASHILLIVENGSEVITAYPTVP